MARLLVTGGAGFLGSHFVRCWHARHPGDQITVLDLLTYAGSRERLSDIEKSGECKFLRGDICDPVVVKQAMEDCRTLVHFAAETHVDRSITSAAPFVRTNMEGTLVLLEQARNSDVARFVFISTDEVYGPVLAGMVDEEAPLRPKSPYAASKAAADLLVQAFWHTHGLPAVIVRPTNIFGPWQLPEKFVPVCITHGLEGRAVPLYGDGLQRRSWLYVEDLCDALIMVVEEAKDGELYNLAGGTERTNRDVAQTILRGVGAPASLLQSVTDRPGHDRRYAMDDHKLRAIGWQPRITFEQGLSSTIAWYREHESWWRPLTQRLREDTYHWLNRPAGSGVVPSARAVR